MPCLVFVFHDYCCCPLHFFLPVSRHTLIRSAAATPSLSTVALIYFFILARACCQRGLACFILLPFPFSFSNSHGVPFPNGTPTTPHTHTNTCVFIHPSGSENPSLILPSPPFSLCLPVACSKHPLFSSAGLKHTQNTMSDIITCSQTLFSSIKSDTQSSQPLFFPIWSSPSFPPSAAPHKKIYTQN